MLGRVRDDARPRHAGKRAETFAAHVRNQAATLREGCEVMNVDQASDLIRETLLLALLISAPLLLIGLLVGLIISLFQAVTQIQEQTLVFVPKIVAMIAAAIFAMPWVAQRLMEYAR